MFIVICFIYFSIVNAKLICGVKNTKGERAEFTSYELDQCFESSKEGNYIKVTKMVGDYKYITYNKSGCADGDNVSSIVLTDCNEFDEPSYNLEVKYDLSGTECKRKDTFEKSYINFDICMNQDGFKKYSVEDGKLVTYEYKNDKCEDKIDNSKVIIVEVDKCISDDSSKSSKYYDNSAYSFLTLFVVYILFLIF
ncbi:hypothetical protein EHI8A_038800 [Entamoeba histolytica HM-1:IMSS-B]|uniref:Uncharacterized protein n=6 Tax=Entamoeba histolytica TaxID=5759 RepID=B1N4G5_ENTH1|nr:hypothetical protein EHI_107930 [Entamoeba histolytica HM-1:IMSS]EMD45135.1 Hypothetical protein EHI5A_135100 [Entamoeba histolytica KU27]EMH76819.1 hypothetical protein EHI8A_038800 [Entamoeba histolytica HM-1:IMSS-B]EMS14410.1 hypothetical protein KM1_080780 [Entamoeba histolytica HM-3:IMSS]ENY60573.1 hypothetical protein EHI7A_039790 [Entamoeba histolytica HM-1:IMSS-A]GAT98346.1 hypothetical protein CL6EHI_107930 [Entamoeba histolytica]|eukprot:XP_001914081.1 hypothetical protein EHI_107930 [Entamoeba histolytica HM-1:IMSS]